MRIRVKTFNEEDDLIAEREGELDLAVKRDGSEFDSDLWNEAMDAFGWPDGNEAYILVSLQDGVHLETQRHDSEEGWTTFGEDPEFGLWDYSGNQPKQILKLGEKFKGEK